MDNVSPVFLSNLLAELDDVFYRWEAAEDPKDELLRLIPVWASKPGFATFSHHPLRDQIREQLQAIRRQATADPRSTYRNEMFDAIWSSLNLDCASALHKVLVHWPEAPPRSRMH